MKPSVQEKNQAHTEETKDWHRVGSDRGVEMDDAYGRLLFTALMGLGVFVSAIFATTVPSPDLWRYISVAICIACFGFLIVGIAQIFRHRRERQKSQGRW